MKDCLPYNDAREASAYEYPQPDGPVRLREYLLTEGMTERYLLFRWEMVGEYPVDGFDYRLEQLDGLGRALAVSEHTCFGAVSVPAGETFVPDEGIVVRSDCVDVRVQITRICSGGYVYRPSGNGYAVDFEGETPWIYDKKSRRKDRLQEEIPLRVTSKRGIHGRFLWVGAVASVVALIAVLILTAEYFS